MVFLYRDDGLELRLLEARHAQELYDLIDRNREHILEWLPFPNDTRAVEDTLGFIERSLQAFGEGRTGGSYGIWHEGGLAGSIGIHEIDRISVSYTPLTLPT